LTPGADTDNPGTDTCGTDSPGTDTSGTDSPGTDTAGTDSAGAGGFVPPPYPYDRLAALAEIAASHLGGMVDLSVGTPCDPPPDSVIEALGGSGAERGYPASLGSLAFRKAASDWMSRRFGVGLDPSHIAACVGTKEFVVSTAWYLALRDPSRDTVLSPQIAYPSYVMGATLANLRSVQVRELPEGGLDLASISDGDAARATLLWVNSPSNPTGKLTDLAAAAEWGRAHGVPVLSDECYAEFTWDEWPPSTILQSGTEGVLAVHSLSKRSNMAGVRVGFYVGDPELVGYLSEVRKHAGMMVPGPVQAAAVVALADDEHVEAQRNVYLRRLKVLADALLSLGLEVELPAGGFYLWVTDGGQGPGSEQDTGGWGLARRLAHAGGLLCSPGEFFGEGGPGWSGPSHVRIAVVQPDDRIDLVCDRLRHAGTLDYR
jgi:succinyldiaminopimelate transaminase